MRTRTPILIVIVGMLLAMMVGLNVAASRFMGGREPEEAAESKAEESKPDAAPRTGAAVEGPNSLASLSPSWTTGPETAKDLVVVGWVWTPEVQANPALVHSGIMAVVDVVRAGSVRVRVVNVDAFPETPEGVSVNGKVVLPLGDDGGLRPESAAYAVRSELSQSGGR